MPSRRMFPSPPPLPGVPGRGEKIGSTGGNRTHKLSPRFELGRFAGLRTVPASVPDGIRTHDLHRDRYAAANTWIPFGPEGVEPSSAVLQTAARPSQLPAQTKRPGILRRP